MVPAPLPHKRKAEIQNANKSLKAKFLVESIAVLSVVDMDGFLDDSQNNISSLNSKKSYKLSVVDSSIFIEIKLLLFEIFHLHKILPLPLEGFLHPEVEFVIGKLTMRAAYQFFCILKLDFQLLPQSFIKRLDMVVTREFNMPWLTFELLDLGCHRFYCW